MIFCYNILNGTENHFKGEKIMTTLGQNIRKLRKERGMTQEELAAKLNISAQAVSKWEMETCSPDVSQIVPLAALFGVWSSILQTQRK